MNMLKSHKSLAKTVGIAIAVAAILINVPSLAGNKTTLSAKPATNIAQRGRGTIIEIADTTPDFKTLATAVKAAELTRTLSGRGPFTLFAPTNAAFAKLPPGTVEKLLQPENKATLQKILAYHVISGKFDARNLKPGEVKTLEGNPVRIKIENGKVSVDGTDVSRADINASNGIIHVIDTVLIPPGLK